MTDRTARDKSFEELVNAMPASIRKALPLARWNLKRLWSLELQVEKVPIEELAQTMDLPLQRLDGKPFQVSPKQVVREPNRFAAHIQRAMQADLSLPVHLIEHTGRTVILDGYHRLLKVVLLGEQTILGMRLSAEDLAIACQ